MFNKNRVADLLSGRSLAVAVLTFGVPVFSFAQAVDPFDSALTAATAKVGTYAAALVGLSAVAVIFMIAMKYVKRIPRAA